MLRESLQENSGGSCSCFRPHLRGYNLLVRIVQPPSLPGCGLTWHCLQLQSEHLNAISSFLDHRTAVDDFLGGRAALYATELPTPEEPIAAAAAVGDDDDNEDNDELRRTHQASVQTKRSDLRIHLCGEHLREGHLQKLQTPIQPKRELMGGRRYRRRTRGG